MHPVDSAIINSVWRLGRNWQPDFQDWHIFRHTKPEMSISLSGTIGIYHGETFLSDFKQLRRP